MSTPIYTLYDILTITNGNVGIGTSDPQRGLHIEGAVMTTAISSPSGILDMSSTTLSNITSITVQQLSVGETVFSSQGSEFSNLSACNIVVDKIAPYLGTSIDFSGTTLSNVTALRVAQILSDGSNINFSTRSLSNIGSLSLSSITSDGANINVSSESLSNIVSVVAQNVTASSVSLSNITSDATNINVNAKTLSNLTAVSVSALTSDSANINVSGKSLSNVVNLISTTVVSGTASLSNITSDAANINVSGKSLSNVANLVSTTVVSGTASLSNITSDAANINVSAKSLSNIASVLGTSVVAGTVSLSNITSDAANINVSAKSLSNVSTLSVNNIRTDGANINFSSSALTGISTINATGDATFGGTLYASNLNVIGDFVTLNTTTSNTEQFFVNNAGTGPALRVVQSGVGSQYAVAEFLDNESGMALRIQDTGLVGIGTNAVQSRLGINGGVAVGGYVDVAAPTNGLIVSGNVGIGSSAPVGALDVGGVITGRDLITQDVNITRYVQSMSRTSFATTGNKFVGFTITWANTTSDQKLSFKVNTKIHFTSDTNTTYSSIEAVITPVDANPKPNGLLIGTPLTTAQNTNNFRNIALTATRNAANAVDLKVNFQANLNPSEAFLFIDIVAPTALGTFTLTPISG